MGSRLECSQGDENNLTVWERKREIGNTVLLVTNIFCLAINLSCILPPAWLHYRNMNTSGTPEQNESELALYQGLWEACFISSNKNSKKICQSLDYRLAKVRTPQLIFSVTTVLTLVSVLMACLEPFRVFFYMEKHSHIFIRGTSLIVGGLGVSGCLVVSMNLCNVDDFQGDVCDVSVGLCFFLSVITSSGLIVAAFSTIFCCDIASMLSEPSYIRNRHSRSNRRQRSTRFVKSFSDKESGGSKRDFPSERYGSNHRENTGSSRMSKPNSCNSSPSKVSGSIKQSPSFKNCDSIPSPSRNAAGLPTCQQKLNRTAPKSNAPKSIAKNSAGRNGTAKISTPKFVKNGTMKNIHLTSEYECDVLTLSDVDRLDLSSPSTRPVKGSLIHHIAVHDEWSTIVNISNGNHSTYV